MDAGRMVEKRRTWQPVDFKSVLSERREGRIIGLSFPENNVNLGLEPSVLTVLPEGPQSEFAMKNIDFNDNDVALYLCSVYISGMDEFKTWASKHDFNKIVVGGYHPTTFPEDFVPYAHKIVVGLCDDVIATITQKGQVVHGITTHKKIPRYDLYDMDRNQQVIPDKKVDERCTSINTSVGCPFRCDFCCTPIMSPKLVSKPLNLVEAECDYLAMQQPRYIFVRDENFPLQKDWRERLQLIQSIGARIYLFASANLLTKANDVQFLRDHGVYMVCLGLENINASYKKNEQLAATIQMLKNHDIMTYLSFIVDPLEIVGRDAGEDFYKRLMETFFGLQPEMVCGNFLMPFRGTKLWDKYYHLVDPSDYKRYDSKTAFLIRNEVVRRKMEFFMFWYQWLYYTSDAYAKIRQFDCEDTLHLRFLELYDQFVPMYERLWDVRA